MQSVFWALKCRLNIMLLDPIYESQKLNLLRSNCNLYIHGHSAGGTNPSLVEAMHLGLPIIAFKVVYNIATTKNKALYFDNSRSLNELINAYGVRYYKVGESLKRVAESEYTWSNIAEEYNRLFLSFQFDYKKKSVKSRFEQLPQGELNTYGFGHLRYVIA